MKKQALLELLRMFLDIADPNNREHFRIVFAVLLEEEICSLNELARICDTSHPNIKRWASGEVLPPASRIIFQWLLEMLNDKKYKLPSEISKNLAD